MTRWHSHLVCTVGIKRGLKPRRRRHLPARRDGPPGQRDDARLVHPRPAQRLRDRRARARALPRRDALRGVLPEPGQPSGHVKPPRLPWRCAAAGLRRRPLARRPVGRRRRSNGRRGNRALPDRLRRRHPGAVRDPPRARGLGHVPPNPRRVELFERTFPVIHSEAAQWGLDLRRGWEVYPSLLVDGADPEEYRLEGTRAVLVEFPGGGCRSTGPSSSSRVRRSASSGRASSRCSPTPSDARRWPPTPSRPVHSRSPGGLCASTRPRSPVTTAQTPSGPRGGSSRRGSCRSSLPTRTALEGRRASTVPTRPSRHRSAATRRRRSSTAQRCPGSADQALWSSPGDAGFDFGLLGPVAGLEHATRVDFAHRVLDLAHAGPEATRDVRDAFRTEEEREDAEEDHDFPDPEAERHDAHATGAPPMRVTPIPSDGACPIDGA